MAQRPDTPSESTNRGWSVAEGVLEHIMDYLANPLSPEDQGREFLDLSNRGRSLTSDLQGVRHLLTTSDAPPSPEVLAVLRSVEQFVVGVQVRTFMKQVSILEASQIELRACLASTNSRMALNDERDSSEGSEPR